MLIKEQVKQVAPAVGKHPVRMMQLDVLRGVAILLVLGRHPLVMPEDAGKLRPLATAWYQFGWTGVDLFFVLSGFLIGGLLFKELRTKGALDIPRFMVRRALKIWPAYYALVGMAVAESIHHRGVLGSWDRYWPNLLHVQNYFGVNPLGQTWSLAIEEHFYLVMPLVLWSLTRWGRKQAMLHAFPFIAVALMIACNLMRLLNLRRPYSYFTHYFPTHLRIDGLAMGVLLAYLYYFRPTLMARLSRQRWPLLIIGAALISPMAFLDVETCPFVWTVGYTMLYLGYACILVATVYTPVGAAGGMVGRFFATRPARVLATIGLFSYSIYLWQLLLVFHPIDWLMSRGLSGPWIIFMSFQVLAACGVGIAMAKLIEFPCIALRDRLFPARSGALK